MQYIPYGRQNINADDVKAVTTTLRSPYLTQGPAIAQFEKAIASAVKAKYAVAVSNGTVALHIAYLSAGIKPGDEVIVPANTFAATANAALYIGAKPVFADIELRHYNLDPTDVERKITKRTRAIVPVHFAGHPVDMDRIFSIARRHNLIVIEDAAHALGASYKGRPIGSLPSAAAEFSFHPVKSITTGEGGMLVTSRKRMFDRLRLLRSHGVTKDARGWNVMTELGFNYRMTDIQAALGTSQMRRLKTFLQLRRRAVRWYNNHLGTIPGIVLPSEEKNVSSAWHLFVIRTARPADRNKLYHFLLGKNIGVNFHYPPVYWHPYYRSHEYRTTALPNTEIYGKSCITLPLHTMLTEKEVRYIASAIREYYRNHG